MTFNVFEMPDQNDQVSYYAALREEPPGGFRWSGFFDPPLYPALEVDA